MTTTVKDFNDTLFELTDEMMGLINPSGIMTTAYNVFKNMYASNPENDVALKAFWNVAQDKEDMIRTKDVKAMADVLRELVPMPGMIDEVWKALSDENRSIVGDYIIVLYDQAKCLNLSVVNDNKEEESGNTTTMYSMYNDIWKEFLLLLEECQVDDDEKKQLVKDARVKMESVIDTKGSANTMIFGVLFPSMESVLPRQQHITCEADIVRLCLPPQNVPRILQESKKALNDVLFPFNKKLPFSDMMDMILTSNDDAVIEKLGTYWHYIRLFTVCVKECPPQILGMMNQMVALFNHSPALSALTDVVPGFLRDDPAVLTKY